ncbi:terminase small subunit [Fusobacterium varium]|uniref:terminase small subunit n=1 Tax=Fusobacterium varium TaxID=856 RepID=UPI001F384846|nr:terminase small subunit [Fusobacterium varium]MCF2673360.1 terminase small subunit [Fusobacterium varium]
MTKNQKIFVNEYLVDLNATRAYKKTYPNIKNDETAAVNGSKLLRNTKVATEIEKRMKNREKRTEVTQDQVVKGQVNVSNPFSGLSTEELKKVIFNGNK